MTARCIAISLALMLVSACTNVGFVDKAKAAANNEFGVEVFVADGSVTSGAFLLNGDATLSGSCSAEAGLSKANCVCQTQAQSRGFSGTFRAWISLSGSVDAICNIQGIEATTCNVRSDFGPFLLKNSSGVTILAENYSELSVTGFRSPVSSFSKLVYTGTRIDGRSSGNDCNKFTDGTVTFNGTGGDAATATFGYTATQNLTCTTTGPSIVCMKQTK